jgi:hypothetical protein
MTQEQDPLEYVLDYLDGVKPRRDGFSALCPAHDDHTPSLMVGQGEDGKVLLHCHAGCEKPDILEAAGLTMADLFPGGSSERAKVERIWAAAQGRAWDEEEGEFVSVWDGKDGATAYAVLEAHCKAAWGAARVQGYGLSLRRCAELTGFTKKTVVKAQDNLEVLGWISTHYPAEPEKGHAKLWKLTVPEGMLHRDTTRTLSMHSLSTFPSGGVMQHPHPRHDTWRWRGLGPNGYRVWHLLRDQAMVGNQIAQALDLHRSTVSRLLRKMEFHELVAQQEDTTWESLTPDLDQVAMDLGVIGASDYQKARHMLERWVRQGLVNPTEAQQMYLDMRTQGIWPQRPGPTFTEEMAEEVLEVDPEKEAVL